MSILSELLALKKDLEDIVGYINENVVSVFGGEQTYWILRTTWKGTGNKIVNEL